MRAAPRRPGRLILLDATGGTRMFCVATTELSAGKIARQTIVQARDE